jgi:hypothetical protein
VRGGLTYLRLKHLHARCDSAEWPTLRAAFESDALRDCSIAGSNDMFRT